MLLDRCENACGRANGNLLVLRVSLPRSAADFRRGSTAEPDSQRAVQQNQSIQTVFVVDSDNKIEARPVKTGARVGESWLIEDGLKAGDRVVVEGLLTVRPGIAVRPVPYQSKQGS